MSKDNLMSGNEYEAFVLKEPVWFIIEAHSQEKERQEIKTLIGESLVEEILDLYEEAKTLLEIWRNYREETKKADKGKSLPDPPNIRENLVQQIKMFVKLFKEKTAREKRDITQVLTPQQSSVIKQIYDKSTGDNSPKKRPGSAASLIDGCDTPFRPSSSGRNTSCSSRLSDYFTSEQDEKDLNELERLSELIREEMELQRTEMSSDITFLQQCLMEESMHRDFVESAMNEPTLKELSDIGLKLEKELLHKPSSAGEKQSRKPPRVGTKSPKRDKITPSPPYGLASRTPVPSPPSSAPTTKTRSHVMQRKQILAKTYSFPSEAMSTKYTKPLPGKETVIANRGSKMGSYRSSSQSVSVVNTTQTTAPCINSIAGSNSRKLREMVLECRDSQ